MHLKKVQLFTVILFLSLFIALSGCAEGDSPWHYENSLKIVFIDVGQGDSTLIMTPSGKVMLIDSGEMGAYSQVSAVLDQNGIDRIDALICTHPHADHIGSMAMVVKYYDVGAVYMPNEDEGDKEPYEALMEQIALQGTPLYYAAAGNILTIDASLTCLFLNPVQESYTNTNNISLALHITYGQTSYLFMGDIEALAENDMLGTSLPLSADVLRLGHHGSNTSSTTPFMEAVAPTYAVYSCGIGNQFGHPHSEILEYLYQNKIHSYRTDEQGHIYMESDGKDILFDKQGEILLPESLEVPYVYITPSGSTYHKNYCDYLTGSEEYVSIEDAKNKDREACKTCFVN